MTLYKCKCGNTKEISKATIVHVDGDWETKEAVCSKCGKYMDSEPLEGMPSQIRTEESLSKKGDKLWSGAKEKLVGDRGINEDY